MRITIDIDSTLHHYWPIFAELISERFGVSPVYEEQVEWGVTGLRRDQVKEVVRQTHADERILACDPYPGAVEVVTNWRRRGHYIQVASHRAPTAARATRTWLRKIGLEYNELHLSYDKVTHAVATGSGLLIDDSPVVLRSALDRGMCAAAIVHPWNRSMVQAGEVVGGRDWSELGAKLEPLLAGGA